MSASSSRGRNTAAIAVASLVAWLLSGTTAQSETPRQIAAQAARPTTKPNTKPTAPRAGKDKLMTSDSNYPVPFGSPRRDSSTSAVTSTTGKLAWSHELGKTASPEWPPAVLLWGPLVAVATPNDIVVFDRDGLRLWTHVKQVITPIAIAQGHLYFKSKQHFLEALDPAHAKVLTEAPFPGAMDGDVKVSLFWPREKDFVAVLQAPGEREVADGDPPDTPLAQPEITVLRNNYPTTYGDGIVSFTGKLALPPLFSPERQVVALAMKREMVRVDIAAQTELSRHSLPLDRVVEWSVDADEVYCFTGYVGTHKVLLAMSGAGAELWRWTDPDTTDAWTLGQPPIRAKGGRVYALAQGKLLAIEHGKLVWAYDVRSEALKHGATVGDGSFTIKDGRLLATGSLRNGTALGDGSVLVTANKTLHHVDAQGHKVFSVNVGADILSPPVVDQAGHVFVSTATHLIRID